MHVGVLPMRMLALISGGSLDKNLFIAGVNDEFDLFFHKHILKSLSILFYLFLQKKNV